MTIVFPRWMPTVGSNGLQFEPEPVDYLSPEAGGRIGAVAAGFPVWTMKIALGNMTFDDADVWRAWLAVQRGGRRRFIAFDIDRQVPRFHRHGRPYNPKPTAWSQAINADDLAIVSLGGLLPGQTVAIGDYVGLVWDGEKRALTRAVETARAGAAGTLSVACEPPIPPTVPAGAAVTLRRAGCLMRLISGETKLGEQGLGYFTGGSTIAAVQEFVA